MPPAQPDRVAWPGTGKDRKPAQPGMFFSADVLQGVSGVPREKVKYLRVFQQDYKTYSTWNKTYRHSGPPVSIIQEEAVKAMEDMGITVVVTEAESFEAIYTSIGIIGKITGKADKAQEIITGMKDKIAEINEKNKDKNKPRVFYVVWTDPLTTAGSNTFINYVIKTAGGINIAEKAEGWAKYSAEQLLADDPDMVVAALHSTNSGISKDALVGNPIFSKLDCVKKGKVYVMSDDNIISRPGPRIVQAIEEMEQIFYGE
jgi:iron complex transport system substrate-binding protein